MKKYWYLYVSIESTEKDGSCVKWSDTIYGPMQAIDGAARQIAAETVQFFKGVENLNKRIKKAWKSEKTDSVYMSLVIEDNETNVRKVVNKHFYSWDDEKPANVSEFLQILSDQDDKRQEY